MKNDIQRQVEELKETNRKLLAENIDLKLENEQLKTRIQTLECVASLLERSGMR